MLEKRKGCLFSDELADLADESLSENDARRVEQSCELEKQTKNPKGTEFLGHARPEARERFCINQV